MFIPNCCSLHSILAMATHGEDPTAGARIRNIQPVSSLLAWLTQTDYENHDQQVANFSFSSH